MSDKKDPQEAVRLDKWLWAARFYKTRSLSRQMIEGGKVEYNGSRAKPSKTVEIGAKVRLLQGNSRREVIIKEISDIRGSASVAVNLYEETAQSIEQRQKEGELRKMAALVAPHPENRPNKKERRALLLLKQRNYE